MFATSMFTFLISYFNFCRILKLHCIFFSSISIWSLHLFIHFSSVKKNNPYACIQIKSKLKVWLFLSWLNIFIFWHYFHLHPRIGLFTSINYSCHNTRRDLIIDVRHFNFEYHSSYKLVLMALEAWAHIATITPRYPHFI